jgi:histidinol-phosphatase
MRAADDPRDDLALALELADAADAISLPLYRSASLEVRHKADRTHVTQADTAVEAAIRAGLAAARPADAVLGEEAGLLGDPASARRWIVDPIDGTANYVRGVPVWATLIALHDRGEGTVGVVSAPALGRRWWAAAGTGAFADGERIHVSPVARLDEAHVSYSDVGSFVDHGSPALADALLALTRRVWRARGLGDFWQHVLVAEGAFDVACEPVVSLWDLAAVDVVVREAGGRFTDLRGRPGPAGGSALSTNGRLHDEVLAAFGPATAGGQGDEPEPVATS